MTNFNRRRQWRLATSCKDKAKYRMNYPDIRIVFLVQGRLLSEAILRVNPGLYLGVALEVFPNAFWILRRSNFAAVEQ